MISDLRQLMRGAVDDRPEVLQLFSSDFGGVVTRAPRVIVTPRDVEDVIELIRYAASRSIPLTVRGAGLSQAGQSLSSGGIVLSTEALDALELDERGEWFRAGAGVTWARVVWAGLELGRLPPVRTYTLRPTVGGTISVGGVGASSFHAGLQVDTCLEIEMITGTGEHVRCTPHDHAELFHWTLGGLGQLGVIVSVRARLSLCPSRVRTWSFSYDNLDTYLRDLRLLAQRRQLGYLEGTTYIQGGRRVYALRAALETRNGGGLEGFETVAGVAGQCTSVQTLPLAQFALPMQGLGVFTEARRPDTANEVHPWVYAFLPWRTGGQFIEEVLQRVPAGMANVVLYPIHPVRRHPMIPMPPESDFLGCGVLTTATPDTLDEARRATNWISARVPELGGHLYADHHAPTGADDTSQEINRLKRLYDPASILNTQIRPHAAPV